MVRVIDSDLKPNSTYVGSRPNPHLIKCKGSCIHPLFLVGLCTITH
jgi:hypothetical protein